MTEHQIQKAFFHWLRLKMRGVYDVAYAIPNGGQRHIAVAAKLKAEGVKAGVPDICIPIARHGFNALYIELKTGKGKATPGQVDFMDKLTQCNNLTVLCRGLDAAIDAIEGYMGG